MIFKDLSQFKNINRKEAYWIGYLLADGCITDKALMLECQRKDKEILEKFCDFLKIRKDRITIGHKGKSYCLSIGIKNFTGISFKDFSLIKNKSSKELYINKILLNNNDLFYSFLKGLLDGDGTIHIYKNSIGVSICGTSKILIEQIMNKLKDDLPVPTSCWIIKKKKDNKLPLYTLKIGAGKNRNNLRFLFDNFYKDNYIVLTRKYKLFKDIL